VRPLGADLPARIDVLPRRPTELGIVTAEWAGLRAGQRVAFFTTAQLVWLFAVTSMRLYRPT
jgi:hypothetical protein